jgi:hypothetical protein
MEVRTCTPRVRRVRRARRPGGAGSVLNVSRSCQPWQATQAIAVTLTAGHGRCYCHASHSKQWLLSAGAPATARLDDAITLRCKPVSPARGMHSGLVLMHSGLVPLGKPCKRLKQATPSKGS